MRKVIIYMIVLFIQVSLPLIQSEPSTSMNIPSIEEVKDFLKGRWYIAKGEGPGGAILVSGIYEITSTDITARFGKVIGKADKYTILSVRPTKSGYGYFIDMKINRQDAGKTSVEEWMVKSKELIIIRRSGFVPFGGKVKDMFLEIERI